MHRTLRLPGFLVLMATGLPYTAAVACAVFGPDMVAMDAETLDDRSHVRSERANDGCDFPTCATVVVAAVVTVGEWRATSIQPDAAHAFPVDRLALDPPAPPTPPPLS